jgi:hypothetical protein
MPELGAFLTSKPSNRRGARFREREVTRITKAVRVAGGGKVTLDPESGRYTIVVASEGEGMPPDNNTDNPWNEVYAADQKRPS